MIGLLSTFIDHMQDRYGATFEAVKFDGYDEMAEALQNGEIDTAFPVYGSYWIAEKNDLMVSGDLTSGYLMVIYRDVYDTDTTSSIAVIENSPFQQFCVQEHFPDAEIITCKSRQECVDAVESGKAKCTLMSSDTYYAYRNKFDNLSDLNISHRI